MQMSSIRAVAAAARVSKSTVSLALRGSTSVSARTRDRVVAAAQRLNYRVNPLVAALMTQQRMGHRPAGAPQIARLEVLPDCGDEARRHLDASFRPLRRVAEAMGYRLDRISVFDRSITPARLQQIVRSRGIRGVILLQGDVPSDSPWALPWSEVSVVQMGASRPRFNAVRRDLVGEHQLALEQLQRRGYRRIGWASGVGDAGAVDALPMSIEHHAATAPARGRVPPLFDAVHWNQKNFLEWYHRHRPDAIISTDLWGLRWLQAAGVRVPETVAFCCLGVLEADFGTCAGVPADYESLMKHALNFLDGLLRRNETGIPESPVKVFVRPHWLEGPTLRPLPTLV